MSSPLTPAARRSRAWRHKLLEAQCELAKQQVYVNLYSTILLPDEVAYFNDDEENAAAVEQLVAEAWHEK